MGGTLLITTSPFDGDGLMKYLAGHAIPGLESGDETHYRRLIRFDGSSREFCAHLDGLNAVEATMDGGPLPRTLIPAVRRLFDLDANSRTIDSHLSHDPALANAVIATPGIRLPGAFDGHEQLLRTMIGQQISIAAARTVVARLASELDGTGLFPSTERWAERGHEVLRGPAIRIKAVLRVAHALHSGELEVDPFLSPQELIPRLVALPGVGPWTAGYVAMRVLGAPDVLLSSDLVLLKGAVRLGLPATARGIAEYGRQWAPYRSYATLHLWRAAQSP